MSQNDLIFLESNFKNWLEARADGLKRDQFVYYCAEHFLKPHDPTDEDILYGITDGTNDGGVDAIYFIVDRAEFIQDDTELTSRKPTRARLVIMQMKSGNEGFKMTEIDKMDSFTNDLLDLSKSTTASPMVAKYQPHLLEIMKTFKEKYLQIATTGLEFTIDYFYITRGDELEPDAKASDSANRVKATAGKHLNKANCVYHFINAQRLLEQVSSRVSKEKMLTWAEQPMSAPDGTVGIVRLKDFYGFLQEDNGDLMERLFESNVRGFQQKTTVNSQIRKSLDEENNINFWLLNNGITIIATKTSSAGHLKVTCEDPQIVNGLQTSREIFNHFSSAGSGSEKESRSILVRLIETADDFVRDSIIKATNSQNKMEAASLRATDPIHHEIEELFKRFGMFYDRRKGFYKDKGKAVKSIVSAMELTKALVAVAIQRPDDARARAGNYVKNETQYASIFGAFTEDGKWEDALPLGVYVNCVKIVKATESFLDDPGLDDIEEGHEHNVKFYLAMYATCMVTKKVVPSAAELASFNAELLTDDFFRDCYKRIWKAYVKLGGTDTVAKGPELIKKLKAQIRNRLKAK